MGKMGFPGYIRHAVLLHCKTTQVCVCMCIGVCLCVPQITLLKTRTNSLVPAYVISLCQKELLYNSCIWFIVAAVDRQFHNTLLLTLKFETLICKVCLKYCLANNSTKSKQTTTNTVFTISCTKFFT